MLAVALSVLLAAPSAEVLTEIDAFVEKMMRADRVPGLSLVIVEGGEVVHARGFGEACPGGPPVTPRTPFMEVSGLDFAAYVRQRIFAPLGMRRSWTEPP